MSNITFELHNRCGIYAPAGLVSMRCRRESKGRKAGRLGASEYIADDMKWLASIAVAILTAILGMLAAAVVGGLLADWHRVSSFEGAAGFFVVGIAFAGLLASFVVGLVTSRVVAARPNPGFLKALGWSCGLVLGILAVIAAGGRLLADIPPTLDGDTLFLQIELRWPAAGGADPRTMTGAGYTRLGTSTGSIVRRQEDGPLFVEDARQEDGRWIVPGAVDVFTARGQRVLNVGIGERDLGAFVVPLPGHPRREHLTWSGWLPHARSGSAPLPDQFTYRFRVSRQSEPLRIERAGPFEIASIVRYFYNVQGSDRLAANSLFRVLYKGQPVAGFEKAESVALVAAAKATLLVQADRPDGGGACHLLVDEGERVRVETIDGCTAPAGARPITSDPARFKEARALVPLPGWLDRATFTAPGLYLTGNTVLDTRTLQHWTIATPAPYPISEVPPLALSRDEHSFVRFAHDGSEDNPVLVVVDFHANRSSAVPIDRARMRYSTYAAIDPAWVDHHFEWIRAGDGAETLAPRARFAVLPHTGEFTPNKPGQYQSYTIRPGREALRTAVMNILLAEPGAERLPDELNGYHQRLRIDGRLLSVTIVDSEPYVYVAMESGKEEPDFMARIAARLDAAFATGKYDDAFETIRKQSSQ